MMRPALVQVYKALRMGWEDPKPETAKVTFSIDMTGMWSGDYADLRLHVTGSFDGWCAGDNKAACASDYTVSPLITRLQPSERDPMIYEVTIPFAPMSARFNTSSTWPGNLDGVVWYKIVPYKWGWATGSYGEQGYPENLDWDQPCLAKDENGKKVGTTTGAFSAHLKIDTWIESSDIRITFGHSRVEFSEVWNARLIDGQMHDGSIENEGAVGSTHATKPISSGMPESTPELYSPVSQVAVPAVHACGGHDCVGSASTCPCR